MTIQFYCIRCFQVVEEEVDGRYYTSSKGICKPCTGRILNDYFDRLKGEPMTSVNVVPAPERSPLESPPTGRKFCWCGCKQTLSVESRWNFIKGHKPKGKAAQFPAPSTTKLPALLKDLRAEIVWRENRLRELEKEIAGNIQRVKVLRQALQAIEAVQE